MPNRVNTGVAGKKTLGSHGAATGARPGPRGDLGKWGFLGKLFFQGGFGGFGHIQRVCHGLGIHFPLWVPQDPLWEGHSSTKPLPPGPHLGPSGPRPSWPIWARAILAHLGLGHLGPSGPGPSWAIWARTIWVPFWPGPFGSRTIWAPFGPGPFGSHLGPGPSGPIGAHGVQWFFF